MIVITFWKEDGQNVNPSWSYESCTTVLTLIHFPGRIQAENLDRWTSHHCVHNNAKSPAPSFLC